MSRLASRSPAAPFQSSRPAPVTPQRPPQSTTTTEAQTLRQMVQEREEEIQRLRKQLDTYDRALHSIRGRLIQVLRDDTSHYPEINAAICDAEDALDGGGDSDE